MEAACPPSRWVTSTATPTRTSRSPTSTSGQISVLVGDTGGTFTTPTNFAAGLIHLRWRRADFNRDGKPDLAAASYNSGNVAVRLNTTVTNQAPTASADTYSTAADAALTVECARGARQRQRSRGQPADRGAGDGPSHGSLTLNPNGSFTYTPAAGYLGSDSFTYRADDGTVKSTRPPYDQCHRPQPRPDCGRRSLQHGRGHHPNVPAPGCLIVTATPKTTR